jgi:hypothetical protein
MVAAGLIDRNRGIWPQGEVLSRAGSPPSAILADASVRLTQADTSS